MLHSICNLCFAILVLDRCTAVVDDVLGALNEAVFVPLSTSASLPLLPKDIAEFGFAHAACTILLVFTKRHVLVVGDLRDVVASGLKLDHRTTPEASLPLVAFRSMHQHIQRIIPRARSRMERPLARRAGHMATIQPWATSDSEVDIDSVRLDESRAGRNVAVGAIFRLELDTLLTKQAPAALGKVRPNEVPREIPVGSNLVGRAFRRSCMTCRGSQGIRSSICGHRAPEVHCLGEMRPSMQRTRLVSQALARARRDPPTA